MEDHELLRVYIEHRSEAAFNELVARISTWSYSTRSDWSATRTGAGCVARGFCCPGAHREASKIRVHWPVGFTDARFRRDDVEVKTTARAGTRCC